MPSLTATTALHHSERRVERYLFAFPPFIFFHTTFVATLQPPFYFSIPNEENYSFLLALLVRSLRDTSANFPY
jgi:hypothetical protein